MDRPLRRLFRLATGRTRAKADFEAELAVHLAMAEDELLAGGHSAEEARLIAARGVGDLRRLTALVVAIDRGRERAERRGETMGKWLTDWRLAFRGLRRDPWFAAAGVTLVALGVGVNIAVFSILNAAFVRALPYPDADRIVAVSEARQGRPMPVAGQNFRDWREEGRGFTALALYKAWSLVLLTSERPEKVQVGVVSRSMTTVLGLAPAHGRWFSEDEAMEGGARAVVLSHRLWRGRFGADPGVLGSTVRLDGTAAAIVGVMPPEFDLPVGTDLWIASELFDDTESRTAHNWNVLGRLAPGVDLAQAERGLGDLTRRLTAEEPASPYLADGVVLTPLRGALLGQRPRVLALLQAAVGLLLVIAILNLTTLLLARAAQRQGEVALTLALGAGRGDLVRRFVVESALLATAGAMLGLLIWLLLRGAALGPVESAVPFVRALPLDGVVLAMLVALILVVGTLAGLLPGLWVGRGAGRLIGGSHTRVVSAARPMRLLIAVEVAATFTLLATAGLLGRSLSKMMDQRLGFETAGRLIVSVDLPTEAGSPYLDHQRYRLFTSQLVERVRTIAGAEGAVLGNAVPLVGSSPDGSARIQGEPSAAGGPAAVSDLRLVGMGFFGALGVPVLAGRDFGAADRDDAPYVAIVNEAFVRAHLRGESPIGREVRFPGMDWTGEDRWATVVGLVGDVRQGGPGSDPEPAIYYDYRQRPQPYRTLYLIVPGATSEASVVLDRIRRVLASLEPTVPFSGRPLDDAVRVAVSQPRLRALVISGFAAAALLLAGVGLFGVIGFVVLQRTRELGVRIALGASAGQVAMVAVRQAIAPVVAGVLIGVGLSMVAGRMIGGLLFEVSAIDPPALGGAAVAVLAVATLACVVPVRRALAVDPAEALRPE